MMYQKKIHNKENSLNNKLFANTKMGTDRINKDHDNSLK